MKRVRKQLLSLLVLALALATVLSVSLFSSSAEEVTYGSATAIENYVRYSGSLTNPTMYPEKPTTNADWAGASIGNTHQIADSIKMQTEGYAYYVDLEYYTDAQWAGNLGMRLRNNWRNSSSDRVALYAVGNGGIVVSNALFQLTDPEAESETIPVTGYGWHHVRGKLMQTAKAVQDPETLKYSLDYDFSMALYVDGVLVKTFEAIEGAFESHHYYLYHAAVDADTGAITYKSVKELYALETSLSTLEGDALTEAEATLAAYGYGATADNKFDFTYVYPYCLTTGLFNRGDDFAGMQRVRALTVSWGSQAKFDVSPVKYNLNGGSLVTEAPVVEPQNVPATVKSGYTWVGVPGATYAFTEVDHYYVDDGAGKTVTPPEAAEKLGAAFLGWYTDEACTVAYDAATPKTGAVMLYAKFSAPGSYSLTIDMLDGNPPAVCYPTDEIFTLGDEAKLWIATDGKAYAAGDSITLTANVTIYPVSLELLEGASVRLDAEHPGLRFQSVLSTALYDALYESCGIFDWEIGTLILPTDLLGANQLTLATDGAIKLNNLTDGVSLKVDREDGTVTFYAAIIDILTQNYARSFTAVSYLKIGEKVLYTAPTARSIYEVAVEAYEGAYADNAIVTGYLSRVIFLTGTLSQVVASGYVSPYTVSWADDLLTVAKKEGSFTSTDEIVSIVINDTVYTAGWSLSDGKLTAPYALRAYNMFTGITYDSVTNSTTEAVAIQHIDDKNVTFKVSVPKKSGYTTIYCTDGEGNSLNYMALKSTAYEKFAGTVNISGNSGIKGALGTSNKKVSISMSLMIPEESDYSHYVSFMLRGQGGTDDRVTIFTIAQTGTVSLPGGELVGTFGKGSFTDFTVTVDFENNKIYGYCNGELTAEFSGMTIPTDVVSHKEGDETIIDNPNANSGYEDIYEWAMAKCTSYIVNGANLNNNQEGTAGLCFDNVIVRGHN